MLGVVISNFYQYVAMLLTGHPLCWNIGFWVQSSSSLAMFDFELEALKMRME
jgi:hypothetical protein